MVALQNCLHRDAKIIYRELLLLYQLFGENSLILIIAIALIAQSSTLALLILQQNYLSQHDSTYCISFSCCC